MTFSYYFMVSSTRHIMQKLLIAIDFSRASQQAYAYGAWLSLSLGAEVHLIYINNATKAEATLSEKARREMVTRDNLEYEQRLRRLATAYPDQAPKDWEELKLRSLLVRNGPVASTLANAAEAINADLLVVGVREKHQLQEYLLGSVSTHLIGKTPCPLLVVPEQAAYEPIKNIAFAVDITLDEQLILPQLKAFADPLGAQVQPFFVNMLPEEQDKIKVERLNAEGQRVDMVRDKSVRSGINYYLEHFPCQMLAMYLPKRAFPDNLLRGNLVRSTAWRSRLPFLVFREGVNRKV
jgi:nucleotide-binding universal stress UspA family protein